MPVQCAPKTLIDKEGHIQTGVYNEPIETLNCLDFRIPGSGKTVPPSRIKRWEYVGIVSDEFIIGGAIVSLHLLSKIFFYVFDRRRRFLMEKNFLALLHRGVDFRSNGASGAILFEKGRERLRIDNDRRAGRHRLEISGEDVEISAEIKDSREPLAFVSRIGFGGFNYTLKSAGMPVAGDLVVGGARRTLDPREACAVIDFTTGCPARETFWNWASGGGRDSEGNRIGINLVQGINETGVTENAFWINDRLVKTDTVTFAYNDLNVLAPWRVRSWDGRVDLTFTPEGERKEAIDLKVLASRFHQPFGSFSGMLIDDEGRRHVVEGLAGYTEEHFARW